MDWDNHIVWIRRQHHPGRGGLVIKQTKGRRDCPVPMFDALEPVLERLTAEKEPDDPLLRGPRGGVLTTATVRDATHWDDLVAELDFDNLNRHGLRHTGATWMADAGIALHVLQEILGHQSIETTKGYTYTPTTGTSPTQPGRQTNSFPRDPPEGTQPAATDATYDHRRTAAPTLPEGPEHRPARILVHFMGTYWCTPRATSAKRMFHLVSGRLEQIE